VPAIDYEKQTSRLMDRVEESEEILEENKRALKELHRDLKVQGFSEGRIYGFLTHMEILARRIDCPFADATEDEIKDLVAWVNGRDLSDHTKHSYKVDLKRFYRWLNGGEYPECVEWIKTTNNRNSRKLPNELLTEDDIERLLEASRNPRDRAFISMLWETGARMGELINLRIGDLQDHRHGMQVVIEGKTGSRRLPLISCVPHVQSWLNSHPSGREKDAPLWVNVGTKNTGKKCDYQTLRKALRETAGDAGVDKPVNPHHFRHSRATYLASRFTEAQMCEWFGWVQGSDRPREYVHMSGRDIDAELRQAPRDRGRGEAGKVEASPRGMSAVRRKGGSERLLLPELRPGINQRGLRKDRRKTIGRRGEDQGTPERS